MTQPEIMKLLNEAADPGCSIERRREIGSALEAAACPEGFPTSTFTVMMGTTQLGSSHYRSWDAGSLFRLLVADRPDLLPKQAAFFLYACRANNREPIDWSLIP